MTHLSPGAQFAAAQGPGDWCCKRLLTDSLTVSHSSFPALALSQGHGAQGTMEVSKGRTVGE